MLRNAMGQEIEAAGVRTSVKGCGASDDTITLASVAYQGKTHSNWG